MQNTGWHQTWVTTKPDSPLDTSKISTMPDGTFNIRSETR